jgi:hypothetical protein
MVHPFIQESINPLILRAFSQKLLGPLLFLRLAVV